MAIQLEEIRARLIADTAQFQAALKAASGSVTTVTGKIPQANRALSSLKQGLTTLAFQAAGVPGPLGKISTALLSMAGGSGLVLGAVAGLGAIALAYNVLTKGAREAAKTIEDLIAVQLKQRDEERSHAIHLQENLATLRKVIDAERAQAQAWKELRAARTLGPTATPLELQNQKKLNDALMAYNRILREIQGLETGAAREARLKKEAEEAAARLAAMRVRFQEELQSQLLSFQFGFEATRRLAPLRGNEINPRTGKPFVPLELAPPVDPARQLREAFETGNTAHGLTEMQELGVSLGRQFMMAFMDGMEDMQDVLKSVMLSLLDFALTKVLTGIVTGGIGAGLSPSVVGPASMDFNVNTGTMPAPMNAFDVARDAHWQRVLRESAMVAKSNGFRFT